MNRQFREGNCFSQGKSLRLFPEAAIPGMAYSYLPGPKVSGGRQE